MSRIREAIHPLPLRERVDHSINALRIEIAKLEHSISELENRERSLYERCVGETRKGDRGTAVIYGSECAQVRKFIRIALQSQLILEKAMVRLEMIREFWDLTKTLGPVRLLVHKARRELEGPLPKISSDLVNVENSLEELVVESGQVTEAQLPVRVDAESGMILEEARTIAESKVQARFPDLPHEIQSFEKGK